MMLMLLMIATLAIDDNNATIRATNDIVDTAADTSSTTADTDTDTDTNVHIIISISIKIERQ